MLDRNRELAYFFIVKLRQFDDCQDWKTSQVAAHGIRGAGVFST
jgi:hypothetical protein